MPIVSALISAISADMVTRLAALTHSITLTDGRILIGRQHIYEQSAPPRIVMIPIRSSFGPRAMYNRSQVTGYPSSELVHQWVQRSVATERMSFEVHVWGQANPPDAEGGDFDATQVLYQTLILSCHYLMVGSVEFTSLVWTDQQTSGSQLIKAGHEAVFGLTIDTPVLDTTLTPAPSNVTANPKTYFQPPEGGTPEQGCGT